MWSYGRYSTGDDKDPKAGPVRIWDGAGRVVADLPNTVQGFSDARLICARVNGEKLVTIRD